MLSREACERRVYRLAVLLSGDPVRATRVISAVIGAQPDLRRLDSAHMDRLTVLRSREIRSATLNTPGVSGAVAGALAKLTRQQREAWVLHYVYCMMPRDMARAMDCSVSAIRQHLLSAESSMREPCGDTQVAVGRALLDYTMTLDVPHVHRTRVQRRKRMKRVVRVAIIAAVLILLGAAVVAVWKAGLFDRAGAGSADEGEATDRAPAGE
jgi:hypothetical protein